MQISRRSCIYGAGVTSLSFLLSDECICLLLVCKQFSLNETLGTLGKRCSQLVVCVQESGCNQINTLSLMSCFAVVIL